MPSWTPGIVKSTSPTKHENEKNVASKNYLKAVSQLVRSCVHSISLAAKRSILGTRTVTWTLQTWPTSANATYCSPLKTVFCSTLRPANGSLVWLSGKASLVLTTSMPPITSTLTLTTDRFQH